MIQVRGRNALQFGSCAPEVAPARLDGELPGQLVADVQAAAQAVALYIIGHDLVPIGLKPAGDLARGQRAGDFAQCVAEVQARSHALPIGSGGSVTRRCPEEHKQHDGDVNGPTAQPQSQRDRQREHKPE